MAADFTDVTIQGIDEEESYQRSGGFRETVFRLAPPPDALWTEAFDRYWDEVEAFPKRHARVENGALVLVCLEHELQGSPMESLRETVERTNASLRAGA